MAYIWYFIQENRISVCRNLPVVVFPACSNHQQEVAADNNVLLWFTTDCNIYCRLCQLGIRPHQRHWLGLGRNYMAFQSHHLRSSGYIEVRYPIRSKWEGLEQFD